MVAQEGGAVSGKRLEPVFVNVVRQHRSIHFCGPPFANVRVHPDFSRLCSIHLHISGLSKVTIVADPSQLSQTPIKPEALTLGCVPCRCQQDDRIRWLWCFSCWNGGVRGRILQLDDLHRLDG